MMVAMNPASQDPNPALQALMTDSLACARRLDAFATSMLSAHGVPQDDNHGIVLFTYAVRMSRYFQAVCKLVECGLNDAAGTTLRCLLEQSFVFCSICDDASLLHRLARESSGDGRKALGGLLKVAPEHRAPELTAEQIEEDRAKMMEGAGFNVFDWAKQCGQTDVYQTTYRRLNTFAHGSMGAITEYLVMDSQQSVQRVRADVAHGLVPDFLSTASAILLNAVNAVTQAEATEPQRTEAIQIESQLEALRQRTYALRNVA